MRKIHDFRPLVRTWFEVPEPGGQRAGLVGKFARTPGIIDGRDDLATVTDNAGVAQQALDMLLVEGGNPIEVEVGEGLAKVFTLAQDGQPGKTGLKPFEADLFEQPPVVGYRPAPFVVMVMQIVRQIAVPEAARDAVGAG